MYCSNCFRACGIVSCYTNLYVGKVSLTDSPVQVVIQNIGSGRSVVENVTTDGDGIVLLSAGTWRKFLTGSSTYKLQVLAAGVNLDIQMYLTATTFDDGDYNCITFDTYSWRDSSGDMYVYANQYLFKSQ